MNQRLIKTDIQQVKLLFFALIVGLVAGGVGAVFRLTLTSIDFFRNRLYDIGSKSGFIMHIWPVLFAIIGVSTALFLVKKFAPEASGSGVHEIEGALDETRPMRWKRVLPIKFIASLFSLGSGLLLGREGPTIQLAANIGKMIKDIFKQPDNENNALVSAGAAAGLASAFNAPFAGIIFVIEEMHGHFRFNFYSVAAIMIASGTADFVVRATIGASPVIQMTVFTSTSLSGLWLFIVLGLLYSVVGLAYNKLLVLTLNFSRYFSKIPIIVVGIFVGLIIAIIGILFPEMIGGGYTTISKVLAHSFSLKFLIILFIVRMLLSIFSYGTGVPGGIFAPLLALGVISGMLFGNIVQPYFPELVSHPGIFAIAGMAGIFASTVRASLTGLVLAVEMTSNYEMILPLIITTVTASTVTSMLGNQPIYSTLLKRTLENTKPKD
ncbi:H(+)/Cl(-) exchange transporter ClcA [Ancylomarina longa]|uniref:H(+)/Cl(-) exchange transporter ClcA n=1 Tax=Ancylomarina longa TaxID=2487017 RepID=UPI001ADE5050|nr:H(+)/Cl(-) exchange transporter ClcA [Ancylomarina longa]